MGFLAWMWELDYSVRDLSVPYPMTDLVSQALTLFLPGVYGNIRSYKELFPELLKGPRGLTNVSTSILQFGLPKPSYPDLASFNYAPRAWIERTANVTFFRRHENGGHFPAFTQPDQWLIDMHDIFAKAK
ncbi:hypothetical protein NQ176_g5635 [Zarea fungicola]|uniref:Uncharacterized protein n=1 Tax=Zarea fungicola TaxID=93591 RepID=A0ACC1N7G2_9HYPO|nr:hypothetical protein NQ176_g5635 [Lecanicillium fungicola]